MQSAFGCAECGAGLQYYSWWIDPFEDTLSGAAPAPEVCPKIESSWAEQMKGLALKARDARSGPSPVGIMVATDVFGGWAVGPHCGHSRFTGEQHL